MAVAINASLSRRFSVHRSCRGALGGQRGRIEGVERETSIRMYRWSDTVSFSSSTYHSITRRAAAGEANEMSTIDPPPTAART